MTAIASASVIQGTPPLEVTFDTSQTTGDIASYSWNFGDGNTSTEANPTHTYANAGQYTAIVEIMGQDGVPSTAQVVITVAEGLQAAFVPGVTSGVAPLQVTFDSSGSTGNIVSYSWDFGDGNTSTEANPTHTYQVANTYNVTLTVTDATNATSVTQPQAITVSAGLQAAFVPGVTSGAAPLQVTFDSSSSTGNIVGYSWDFGDGNTSTEVNPTHTYQSANTYNVTLTVTDATNATSVSQPQAITVSAGLQAAFVPGVTSGAAPLQVTFDSSSSTGNIVGYSWDFGDGNTSTEVNPTHTYQSANTYNVTLTVTDATNATSVSQPQAITVSAGLQAAFVPSVIEGTAPLEVNFDSSGSTGDISTFLWEFGDGNTSTDPNPIYIYQQGGIYTVDLTLSDIGGATSSAQATITVTDNIPAADPAIVFASERDGNRQIYVMNADGSNVQRIIDTGGTAESPSWSINNKIVFALDNQLYTMDTNGGNVAMVSADGGATAIAGLQPSWSPDGSRIVFVSEQDGNREIYVVNADGSNLLRLTDDANIDEDPEWSPNGAQIAFVTNRDGNREIYVMSADGSNPVRLTTNDTDDVYPSWSSDSTRIAFAADRDGNREIYIMNTDGSNAVRLTNNGVVDEQPTWTSNNSQIVFVSEQDGNREIYIMNADGSNTTRLTDNGAVDIQPDYKP